jgi:hypothetical protein
MLQIEQLQSQAIRWRPQRTEKRTAPQWHPPYLTIFSEGGDKLVAVDDDDDDGAAVVKED